MQADIIEFLRFSIGVVLRVYNIFNIVGVIVDNKTQPMTIICNQIDERKNYRTIKSRKIRKRGWTKSEEFH